MPGTNYLVNNGYANLLNDHQPPTLLGDTPTLTPLPSASPANFIKLTHNQS